MIRAPLAGLAEGERALPGPVAHYLARVLRLRAGDAFVAFDPSCGVEADGLVTRVDRAQMVIVLSAVRKTSRPPLRDVVWVQGLAKGDKCDAIVRDATELGATRLVVATTQRSVVRLDAARAVAKAERWSRIASEAARQAGRGEAPVVEVRASFELGLAVAAAATARFCLYERATEPLAPQLFSALAEGSSLAFAAGPEGGLDEAEVATARDLGWEVVSLGALTLRTETVAAAVLGAVRVWAG